MATFYIQEEYKEYVTGTRIVEVFADSKEDVLDGDYEVNEIYEEIEADAECYETNMIDNVRSGVYKSLGVNIKCPLKEGTLDGLLDHNSEFIRDHNNQIIQDDGLGITAYNGNIPASGNLLSESITTSVDGLLAIDLQFRNFI